MSSAGNSVDGEGVAGLHTQQYFCYQCNGHVTIAPPPSPTAELVCPSCLGDFLEESQTAPAANPTDSLPNPLPGDSFPPFAAYGGGFPVIFSSPSAAPGGGGRAMDDLSAFFGTRSPNESNPFTFLNNYLNNIQARGGNIQIVFESPGGGGVDFGFPANLGDYFVGPGLEQLIQQLAENDPNRYGTPRASKSAVEGLPDIKITAEILASDLSQCAVYELPTDDPDYENQRTRQTNNSLGSGALAGSDEGRDDNNNSPLTPRTIERRYIISLPWPFRGFGSPAETSGGGNNNGSNNTTNNSNIGSSNTDSGGGQAMEEDLD
ncbi:hypothetical protein OROGR_022973 [Orobanche gracilis]